LVGKMSTVMEKLRAKTQYQLAICDLGFSGLVNPKIVNRLLEEKTFRGPAHEQIRQCLRYLENFATHHLEKVRDRAETRGWVSYPSLALRESVVNAVYHRSYDGVIEPTKIYLYPNRIEASAIRARFREST